MSKLTLPKIAILSQFLKTVQRYSILLFVLFVAGLYGAVFYQFYSLSDAEPSESAVSSQVKAARVPHIDEDVLKQLQSLQDNSVSVQALFNEKRNNPFQ